MDRDISTTMLSICREMSAIFSFCADEQNRHQTVEQMLQFSERTPLSGERLQKLYEWMLMYFKRICKLFEWFVERFEQIFFRHLNRKRIDKEQFTHSNR